MSLTIRENILANIKTTLDGITIIGGYDNAIGSVQRWKQNGNDYSSTPLIIISVGPERNDDRAYPLTFCSLVVNISLWYSQPESDTAATDIALNSLLGDIKKALKADVTRGGNAIDTNITSVDPFETIEGQQFAGFIVSAEISYRHKQSDPKVAG